MPFDQSFYHRWSLPILAVFVLLIPLWVWGAYEANARANNNVRQWLPEDMEATETYNRFREHFGSDEFAAVSWQGMTSDDPRVERFVERAIPADPSQHDPNGYFDHALTPRQLLDQLTGPPFNLAEQAARERLAGVVLSPDSDQALMLVFLTPHGDANRLQAVRELRRILIEEIGIPEAELHMAGDPVVNAAIDVESERAIGSLLIWSMVVACVVAWWSIRSLRLILAVFAVAGYSFVMAQGLVFLVGGQMNLVLVVMPVLVYVLTLSAGIHVVNYYRDAAEESGRREAPALAIEHGWVPCLLAATTTAVGVGSLTVSHIVPVKEFGAYSALGIMASLALIFLVLPSLLTQVDRLTRRKEDLSQQAARHHHVKFFQGLLSRFGRFVIRHARPIFLLGLIVLAGFAAGVPHIDTSVKPRRFFPDDHRLVQDLDWLSSEFGAHIPVELVVSFDKSQFPDEGRPEAFQDTLNRLRLVRAIENTLRDMPDIGGTMSAATFAPPLTIPRGFGESTRRYALNRQLSREESRRLFSEARFLSESEDRELWRISARVRGLDDNAGDYDTFLRAVERHVQEYLESLTARDARYTAGVEVEYTGMVPLFFAAQNELLASLNRSFLTAFGIIAVLVIFLLRSFAAGLLSMLPNVFPAAVIFGGMGWTGTIVDIGSMMTASVAMGIAVDDTLHFLTWFRRGMTLGMARDKAIQFAYDRCGMAMLQTTAIAGLGLVVYALSSFQPVSQFGLLMFVLLIGAIVGDLIFLPALLATRLGRFFESRTASLPPSLEERYLQEEPGAPEKSAT